VCEVLRKRLRIGKGEVGGAMIMQQDHNDDDEAFIAWRLINNADSGGSPRHKRSTLMIK
jgi:hypothetical protein